MADDEKTDHRAAQHHRAGARRALDIARLDVGDRPSCRLYRRELNRRPCMQQDGNQKKDTYPPEQSRTSMQRFRVVVHHLASQENLKVAKHVANEKSGEDQARHRHDRLLADCGIVESSNRNRTHKLPLSPLCKRNIVSKKVSAQSGVIETAVENLEEEKSLSSSGELDSHSYKEKFSRLRGNDREVNRVLTSPAAPLLREGKFSSSRG